MKVLVTGATGKSGRFFLENVLKDKEKFAGFEFSFIIRSDTKADMIKKYIPNANIFVGSLDDVDFLSKVCKDNQFGCLLHIAGIMWSLNLCKVAVDNGVNWLVLVHTTGIFSKYKKAGEGYRNIESQINDYIKDKRVDLTILRPTMIYGSLQDNNITKFIKMVDKLKFFPVVNGGKYPLQPVWCGDLGSAYSKVLLNKNKTANKNYNLSGKNEIYLVDLLREIAKQLGKKRIFFPVPFFIAYFGAWVLYLLTFSKIDYREKVQRLVEPRVFSHKEANEDFGYSPVSFEEGVKNQICEYRRLKSNKQ